jgi:hypothetical protein
MGEQLVAGEKSFYNEKSEIFEGLLLDVWQ